MSFHRCTSTVAGAVLYMLVVCQGAIRAQPVPAPDIRVLMEQLNDPKNNQPDTIKKVVELAGTDLRAREYVIQKLPDMIRGPESDVWLDAIRLAGKLNVKETIPALQEAMLRPPFPAEPYITSSGMYRLDDDIVARTLSQFGDPAIPTVVNLLKSGNAGTRYRAVLMLRNIGSPAAHKILQHRLADETDSDVRKLIVDSSILAGLTPAQSTAPASELPRFQIKQEQLRCNILNAVNPIYPSEARLAHTEGVVNLIIVIAGDGTVADLQAVSGDPLLLDSTVRAIRQWRFQPFLLSGRRTETDVALSFTFIIQDPPKPAYLHLTNGDVIRADEVREFTDRIEYHVGRRTRHLSPESVTDINACAHMAHLSGQPKEGDCVPGSGPSFTVRAFPLLSADKPSHSGGPAAH